MRPGVLAAMMQRDFAIARSYRVAFAFDLLFGVLNLLVFYFISKAVTPRDVDLSGATTYFDFAAVGLALTLVLQATTTQLAGRIREEQLTGTLEALWSQPLSAPEVAVGVAGFPFLFATMRAAAYVVAAGIFFGLDVRDADWLGFALVLCGAGAAMGAIGVVIAAAVVAFKRGEGLAAVLTFGLGLLGGALFPISVLPEWVRALSVVTPTRYAFEGARAALFEGAGWGKPLFALIAFVVVALPVSLWIFRLAIDDSLRKGSLSQY